MTMRVLVLDGGSNSTSANRTPVTRPNPRWLRGKFLDLDDIPQP